MLQVRKILVVDDDEDLRGSLVEQLGLYDEFALLQASTAAQALIAAREHMPDLALMDIGLPDMDGREAVKLLRREGFSHPIIILTGHAEDEDTIGGLEAGANDYVSKPFKFNVLLARIRSQLRQFAQSEDANIPLGDYVFHPRAKHLTSPKGEKIRLTEKETAILRFLHRVAPNAVKRDVLLREVWGYNAAVTTHTLETHIYRLRQKIEMDPLQASLLLTENGGYRLACHSVLA